MSYESQAEPIKLGYLFDFKLPLGFPRDQLNDLTDSFALVFRKGRERGVIARERSINDIDALRLRLRKRTRIKPHADDCDMKKHFQSDFCSQARFLFVAVDNASTVPAWPLV